MNAACRLSEISGFPPDCRPQGHFSRGHAIGANDPSRSFALLCHIDPLCPGDFGKSLGADPNSGVRRTGCREHLLEGPEGDVAIHLKRLRQTKGADAPPPDAP